MTLALPKPVADYFAAEKRNDPEALSSCFAPQSRVQDEGRTIVGTAAIAQWMIETKKRYQHTVEPLSAAERDGRTVVVARVAGNFPNSPLDLEHIFSLAGDKIAALEIR